jgi:hypothetical protein
MLKGLPKPLKRGIKKNEPEEDEPISDYQAWVDGCNSPCYVGPMENDKYLPCSEIKRCTIVSRAFREDFRMLNDRQFFEKWIDGCRP